MIVQFKVKNYRSISTEQVLSFLAQSQDSHHKGNTIATPFGDVLKSIAIYGANASGKSNVLKALNVFCEVVAKSVEIDSLLPSFPFAFAQNIEPTELELIFIVGKKLYRYGFAFDTKAIVEEWLFATSPTTQRESEIFYRVFDEGKYHYKYGRSFRGEKKVFEERTRANSLFLSKCAFENQELMRELFLYIKDKVFFLIQGYRYFFKDFSDTRFLQKQEKFLKDAGIEFDTLLLESNQQVTMSAMGEVAKAHTNEPIYSFLKKGKRFYMEDESEGSTQLLAMSAPLIKTIESGGIIIVDELEKSLHPLIVGQIVKQFHDNNKAQILFTTHNTTILKSSIFCKDQIYFTEKNDYATELYSLLEFKGIRSEDNYEKKYLAGNYGALPILRDFELGDENGER